jgi:hypothetical protein
LKGGAAMRAATEIRRSSLDCELPNDARCHQRFQLFVACSINFSFPVQPSARNFRIRDTRFTFFGNRERSRPSDARRTRGRRAVAVRHQATRREFAEIFQLRLRSSSLAFCFNAETCVKYASSLLLG